MLGDRLFLDRKLFKFSFFSDDLEGTQSTRVELKSRRDLAINGHVSWGPRQGMRYFLQWEKCVGCGVRGLQNHGVEAGSSLWGYWEAWK